MSRRRFLKTSAALGASAAAGGLLASGARAQRADPASRPIRIIMSGYGPATTSFSLALKRMGDRLESRFGDEVEVRYVYNILDLGYRGLDILWLVEEGILTLGYQSSSYLTDRVPELGLVDLPFLFRDTPSAPCRHGRGIGAPAHRRDRGPDRLPDTWLFRERFAPHVQPGPARALAAGPRGSGHARAAQPGASPYLRVARRRPADHGSLGGHRTNHRGHPGCSGESFREHGHLRGSQLPRVPYRQQSLLHFAAHFRASTHIRFLARGSADGTARGGGRRSGFPAQPEGWRGDRCGGGDPGKPAGEILELTPEEVDAFIEAVQPIYVEAQTRYSRELLDLAGL